MTMANSIDTLAEEKDLELCTVKTIQKLLQDLSATSDRPKYLGTHKPHWMQPSAGGIQQSPLTIAMARGGVIAPTNSYHLVYPGIYIGDEAFGRDQVGLKHLNITHILNAAQGPKFSQINTSQEDYKDAGITFLGIPAQDVSRFKLSQHFRSTADFIEDALQAGGKVAVHCHQGVSRSATLVIAYLMLKTGMKLPEAVKTIRQQRAIYPNEGFLKQLCELNNELHEENVGSG